jgi:hypothetical protein
MNRRIQKKILWWLMPLFALRALVPVGFMLDVSHGDVAIVVCPGHGAAEQDLVKADALQSGGQSNSQSIAKLCPFAVAGGVAPPTFVAGLLSFDAVSGERVAAPSAPETGARASHAHLIRGPPALS